MVFLSGVTSFVRVHLHSGPGGVDVEALKREVEELRQRNQQLEEENRLLKEEAEKLQGGVSSVWCVCKCGV